MKFYISAPYVNEGTKYCLKVVPLLNTGTPLCWISDCVNEKHTKSEMSPVLCIPVSAPTSAVPSPSSSLCWCVPAPEQQCVPPVDVISPLPAASATPIVLPGAWILAPQTQSINTVSTQITLHKSDKFCNVSLCTNTQPDLAKWSPRANPHIWIIHITAIKHSFILQKTLLFDMVQSVGTLVILDVLHSII